MADRIGVISHGEIILVEEKDELMRSLGKKQLRLHSAGKARNVPEALSKYGLELSPDGGELIYTTIPKKSAPASPHC